MLTATQERTEERTQERLPLAELEVIAGGLARTATGSCHTWTQGQGRRYARLVESELFDAWLIAWRPAASLDMHDHGGSDAAVAVAEGRLVETYTELRSRHPLRSRVVEAGETIDVPARRIHGVFNPGRTEAVSVHVYSPPLGEMTFYEETDRE